MHLGVHEGSDAISALENDRVDLMTARLICFRPRPAFFATFSVRVLARAGTAVFGCADLMGGRPRRAFVAPPFGVVLFRPAATVTLDLFIARRPR